MERAVGRAEGRQSLPRLSVQPIFANGLIYAPDKAWADLVITEMANFPKGKYSDLTGLCHHGFDLSALGWSSAARQRGTG